MVFSTIQERAQRLYSTKGKRLEDLDPTLFSKPPNGKKGLSIYFKLSIFFLFGKLYLYCSRQRARIEGEKQAARHGDDRGANLSPRAISLGLQELKFI